MKHCWGEDGSKLFGATSGRPLLAVLRGPPGTSEIEVWSPEGKTWVSAIWASSLPPSDSFCVLVREWAYITTPQDHTTRWHCHHLCICSLRGRNKFRWTIHRGYHMTPRSWSHPSGFLSSSPYLPSFECRYNLPRALVEESIPFTLLLYIHMVLFLKIITKGQVPISVVVCERLSVQGPGVNPWH